MIIDIDDNIEYINHAFLDFFDEYKSIDDVKKKDLKISDKFEAYDLLEDLPRDPYSGAGLWRLPTIEELEHIYDHREKFNIFSEGFYWSSTKAAEIPNHALGGTKIRYYTHVLFEENGISK